MTEIHMPSSSPSVQDWSSRYVHTTPCKARYVYMMLTAANIPFPFTALREPIKTDSHNYFETDSRIHAKGFETRVALEGLLIDWCVCMCVCLPIYLCLFSSVQVFDMPEDEKMRFCQEAKTQRQVVCS